MLAEQPKISYEKDYLIGYHKVLFFVLILLYAIVIIFTSCQHEVWRDEVRPLNLATESRSVTNLFENLRNEGHPALWHLILYFNYNLVRHPLVLKITNISIAIIAMGIFLWSSPFSWIQKGLFLFGYFPIYEYSVINRNYCISMLLLFCFCALYRIRINKIIVLSITLFLLAQTNVYSLIIVMSICVSLLLEYPVTKKNIITGLGGKSKYIIGLFITFLGINFSILQILPDATSTVFHGIPSASLILNSLFSSIIIPGRYLSPTLGFHGILIGSVIVWVIYIYLLRKPFILIIYFLSVVGIVMFFELVYGGSLRHQGFLFLLIIVAFWLDELETDELEVYPRIMNQLIAFFSKNKSYFIILLLLIQVLKGFTGVMTEINKDFSSSKKLGQLINKNADLRQAIIIGEPDYQMEALPYYVENPIYLPRENRFGKKVNFTQKNKGEYSLEELLITAARLKSEFQKPVLLVIGHELSCEGPHKIFFPYGRYFIYNNKSLQRLNESTIKIASFREAITDENYEVFLLK